MDEVILLSEDGDAIGVFPKDEVHTRHTPLHLAFSCHVLDDDGRLLVTRRALGKQLDSPTCSAAHRRGAGLRSLRGTACA